MRQLEGSQFTANQGKSMRPCLKINKSEKGDGGSWRQNSKALSSNPSTTTKTKGHFFITLVIYLSKYNL
jgi:hypothetical protein